MKIIRWKWLGDMCDRKINNYLNLKMIIYIIKYFFHIRER